MKYATYWIVDEFKSGFGKKDERRKKVKQVGENTISNDKSKSKVKKEWKVHKNKYRYNMGEKK